MVYGRQKDAIILGRSDADWIADQNDRTSTTNFCFQSGLPSGAISFM